MTRVLTPLAFVALFAAAAAAEQQPSARLTRDQPLPPTELEAFVDGVVRQSIATDHLVGVAVSVVQAGAVILEKGYGFADLEAGRRVDPDTTLFRIGSITKTFTWIGLMKAVEAGKLGLDDPVNDYLPPELRIPDQGFTRPIRIKHLMMHSPGFEDRALARFQPIDATISASLAAGVRYPSVIRGRVLRRRVIASSRAWL